MEERLVPRGSIEAVTPESANERIRRKLEESVRYYARNPEHIAVRLRELDREWTLERALITNASTLSVVGLALAAFANRRWLILPGVVNAFLLQHGVQGWCPPLPLLRRLGVRTGREIDLERHALRGLRGDFDGVGVDRGNPAEAARRALQAAGAASR